MQTKNYILTCSCPGTPDFAKEAFSILCPGEEYEIYSGRSEILDLSDKFANTEFDTFIRAYARNQEKFAMLFVVDDGGMIKRQVNLKTGSEVL